MRRWWSGGLTLALLAALIVAALVLQILLRGDPVLGTSRVQSMFSAVTIISASIAIVLVTGRLLIAVTLSANPATSFQRVLIYGALTFVATALLLAHFGFNLSTILTTSAIVTAAVGLAMQPTLASIIAGLAVHINGVVRLDDGIEQDGEWARVVSMTWRSVIAQKASGALVVVPNNLMADHTVKIMRAGLPLRFNTYFDAPVGLPPERISALVSEMVSDLAAVDASRPVAVAPAAYVAEHAATRYCIHYSILDWSIQGDMEREVLRRLWYVFQRNNIRHPTSRLYAPNAAQVVPVDAALLQRHVHRALNAGGRHALGLADTEANTATLAAEARLLLYGPDERLVVPEDTEGATYLLAQGTAVPAHEFGLDETELGRPVLQSFRLGADARVRQVAERLAADIGPYAEVAVRRAAASARDLPDLCRRVAQEIEDTDARARFLAAVEPPALLRYGPGLLFHARRNAAGTLTCHLALRVETEAMVLAIPPALLARLAHAGRTAA